MAMRISAVLFATLVYLRSCSCSCSCSSPESFKAVLPDQPVVSFKQYSGYITVDVTHDRSLFFYFVEAELDPATKPVVLWLNGGPGCSSVGQGAFTEHGPFKLSNNGHLVRNNYSWNREANMLYLESPAGVGFSYSTNQSDYYLVNDEITARDNLLFLQGWYSKFPNYKTNPFFISGESYIGHYAPQLAHLILQSKSNINLKGILMGNPLLDFDHDYNSRAEYLWSHSQISDSTYHKLTHICNNAEFKRQDRMGNASVICEDIYLQMITEMGNIDPFDVTLDVCIYPQTHRLNILKRAREEVDVCLESKTFKYLNRKDVQIALHGKLVGEGVYNWSTCSGVLVYDFQNLENPTISMLGPLVKSGVRVLAYSGDQDSEIPFFATRSLIKGLAKDLGLTATDSYRVWYEGSQVAGWTEGYGEFLSFATIRGAAHAAPFSQPARALVLFKAFVEGKSLPTISEFVGKLDRTEL